MAYPALFNDLSCADIECQWDSSPLPSGVPADEWICGSPVENPQTLSEQRSYELVSRTTDRLPRPGLT